MPIELGAITLSDALVRQLKQDLRDDWFPDPLEFKDMIDGAGILEAIERQFNRDHGEYVASERTVLNLPKSDYTIRTSLETGLADRAVYHAAVAYLVPFFDPLIPWQVFNHRQKARAPQTAPVEPGDENDGIDEPPIVDAATVKSWRQKGLFRAAIPIWQDFVGSVRTSLSPGDYLLSTDIANYYENIEIERLKSTLLDLIPLLNATPREKSAVRNHVQFLFGCLNRWSYTPQRGLPQNRDASSFLANLYMRDVDLKITNLGVRYFRYMDDIKIICSDELSARRTLKQLALALREVGLSLNSKKTVICSSDDHAKIKEHLDVGSPEMQRLDAAWRSRSLRPILRILPHLKNLALQCLAKRDVGSREFRFCINRLTALAGTNEIEVPEPYFSEVTEGVLDCLLNTPHATDVLAGYLRRAPTSDAALKRIADHLMSDDRNFYTWQCYRLWVLLVQKSFVHGPLLDYAANLVQNSSDDPHRAGATIYLGALGTTEQREGIARSFPNLKSFLGQRSAIIGIHELKYRPLVEDFVKPSLRDDLQGVFTRLGKEGKGQYIAKDDGTSIFKLIDPERDYV